MVILFIVKYISNFNVRNPLVHVAYLACPFGFFDCLVHWLRHLRQWLFIFLGPFDSFVVSFFLAHLSLWVDDCTIKDQVFNLHMAKVAACIFNKKIGCDVIRQLKAVVVCWLDASEIAKVWFCNLLPFLFHCFWQGSVPFALKQACCWIDDGAYFLLRNREPMD